MATMYELIMDLPLFKGVSKNQVSHFLEKTSISFRNYNPGDSIIGFGENVDGLKFVVKGEVNVLHTVGKDGIKISERCGSGNVFGAEHLFGLKTYYPYSVVSVDKCSIMEFDKKQYMNLLKSDNIYLLNFFNYLSVRVQRMSDIFLERTIGTSEAILYQLLSVITDPLSSSIMIYATDKELANYCDTSLEEIERLKLSLQSSNVADCSPYTIHIPSRTEFLAHFEIEVSKEKQEKKFTH